MPIASNKQRNDKMHDGVAVIKVNNIEVGAMPLAQYEAIVKEVKKDWRTHIASVLSYAGFVWRIASRLWSYFIQSFAVVFSMFMLYSLYHSPEITQFITALRNAPSENLAEFFRTITSICITLTVIALTINLFLKGAPVFVSASEIAINKKIREVMEVPTEGQVSVSFKKDGVNGVK